MENRFAGTDLFDPSAPYLHDQCWFAINPGAYCRIRTAIPSDHANVVFQELGQSCVEVVDRATALKENHPEAAPISLTVVWQVEPGWFRRFFAMGWFDDDSPMPTVWMVGEWGEVTLPMADVGEFLEKEVRPSMTDPDTMEGLLETLRPIAERCAGCAKSMGKIETVVTVFLDDKPQPWRCLPCGIALTTSPKGKRVTQSSVRVHASDDVIKKVASEGAPSATLRELMFAQETAERYVSLIRNPPRFGS